MSSVADLARRHREVAITADIIGGERAATNIRLHSAGSTTLASGHHDVATWTKVSRVVDHVAHLRAANELETDVADMSPSFGHLERLQMTHEALKAARVSHNSGLASRLLLRLESLASNEGLASPQHAVIFSGLISWESAMLAYKSTKKPNKTDD